MFEQEINSNLITTLSCVCADKRIDHKLRQDLTNLIAARKKEIYPQLLKEAFQHLSQDPKKANEYLVTIFKQIDYDFFIAMNVAVEKTSIGKDPKAKEVALELIHNIKLAYAMYRHKIKKEIETQDFYKQLPKITENSH